MAEKNIGDVIAELHRDRKTGVLTLSVSNDNNQFKFFLQDGAVYYVTYSACRNLECLIKFPSLHVEKGFFLPGAKVEVSHTLMVRTEDIIEQVRNVGKVIPWTGSGGLAGRQDSGDDTVIISGSELKRLEDDLLDLIGPAAILIIERALKECGIQRGAVLSKGKFVALIQAVSHHIPDDAWKKLITRFSF